MTFQEPLRNTPRAYFLAILGGALVLILGLSVLFGWITHNMALIVGIVLAAALSLSVFLAQAARNRERGIVITIRRLATEIDERKQAEEKLRDKDEELAISLHDKGERVKEITCLYSVAESIQSRTTLDEIFQDVAELIPPGWHYPEITRGKVIIDGKEYVSEPFEETIWKQSSDIMVNGEPRGSIEVYYLEECPELDEGPFMAEERKLLKELSKKVSEVIERKRAEKEISRFSRIFEDTLNEIYLFDVGSLKFVQVNNAAQHNLGYSLEELREMTPVDIKPELTTESFRELLVPLRKGEKEKLVFETVHQRKDKSRYDVDVHLQLLKHEHEELFAAIILDVTDKKKQEAALSQAQKMEAVGQLTGGIAHDFNNLLSIISGNLRFLRQDVGEISQDIDELFEDATSAVDDGAELTQRLLAFSRKRSLHSDTMNVNDTIEKSARFLSRTLADNTELETVLPDEDLFISVDPSQLENALLNLCINARDAMPKGGTITISTERCQHCNVKELILPEGSCVKISVTDTGSGISPEDLQHVYEPFFTTKEVGKGSGLGLSMVFGFTQQSQGGCHIESTPGEGTTVSMYFPEFIERRGIERKPVDTKEEQEKYLHGSEVILVVEDDPRVRRVTLRDLKMLGFKTLEAENAYMARTIIESGEQVDLLLSDILMPGAMDGHMLAVWTEEHYPEIKIVLTSGFSKGKTEVKQDKKHPFPFLRKPYSAKKLAEQIKSALYLVND